jgi:hypothetical protein
VSGHGVQLLLGIAVGAVVYCVLAAPWLRRVIRTLREMYWLPTSDEEPGESPEADRILQRSTEQVLGESGA